MKSVAVLIVNKGNNKITELRTILQRESQNSYLYTDKISQQPENCENRNDPDLVQVFLKKWWVVKKCLLETITYVKVSDRHVELEDTIKCYTCGFSSK
jgi:hypothetical protein